MKCELLSRRSRGFNYPNHSGAATQATHRASATASAALMAIAGCLCTWTGSARGDTYGNIAGPALNTPGSWTDETVPATDTAPPGAADIARWDASSAGGTFNLGTGTSWLGISIANPASAVTIGAAGDVANSLTLGTSGIDMSAAAFNLSIADPVVIGGAQTWNIITGKNLTVSGTLNTNGNITSVLGAGSVTASGVISGAGGFTMGGTGTLSLTKANTYSGGTIINSGTVALTTNTSAGNAAGDTITLNGGTLNVAGAGSSALGNNVVVTTGDSATISGSGTEEFSGTFTGGGTLNLAFGTGATFDITNTGLFTSFTGIIEMGASVGTIRYGGSSAGGSLTHALLDLGTSTGSINNRLAGSIGIGALQGSSGTVLTGSSSAGSATTYSIGGAGLNTVFSGSVTNGSFSSGATTALTIVGGTLVLAGGSNTYTGGTTITSGTLQIGNGGTTGSVGTAGVVNNSMLNFSPGASGGFTIANAISGSGLISHIGAGTTTLTGNNSSFTGGTNISAGTLVANNITSALGTGPVSVFSTGSLTGLGNVNAAVTVGPSGGTIAGGSSGVGTLTVSSLTLNTGSVVNTFFNTAGPTNLISITTSNALIVNGGGINLFTAGNAPLSLNGTYNIFQFPSPYTGTVPTNLLTVLNPPSGSATYTWIASGNDIAVTVGGLASATAWQNGGGGSWTLAGNWTAGVPNGAGAAATLGASPGITAPSTVTLDGSKTVGSLIFNNNVGVSPGISYTVASGSGGSLIIDNGTASSGISDLNGSQLISAPVVFNSTALVSITNSTDAVSISGPITGNGGLTVAGAGTLILTGADSYLGATNISSGTLQVGTGGTAGSIPAGPIIDNGTLVMGLSTGATVSGISGTGGLVQAGSSTLIVSGANTYTGTTNVSAGSIQIATGGSLGTGPLIVASGSLLDINGSSVTASSLAGGGIIDDVTAGGTPVLTVGSSSSSTFSGSIRNTTGTVNLVKVGTGALTLTGANTYTGTTNVSAGTLTIGTGGSVTGGALIGQGFIVSGGTLTIAGTSTLVAAATDFSETAGNVTLGALNANDADTTLFNLSGGNFSAGSIDIPRSFAYSTAPTVAAPLAGQTTSGFYVHGTANVSLGTLTIANGNSSSSIRIDNGTLTVSGEVEVGAIIDGSARYAVLQVNGGTLNSTDPVNGIVVSQNGLDTGKSPAVSNASFGQIYLSAGVTNAQKIGFGLATDTVAGGKGFLIVGGGTLYLGSGGIVQNDTVGYTTTIDLTSGLIGANASWSSSLPMAFTGSSFTLQTANASGGASNIALSGNLSGAGGLTATGAGALTLSGNNTYANGTVVNAGTLVLASANAFPANTSLTTALGAQVTIANHSSSATYVPTTSSLSNSGTIDVTNNAMIVHNGSFSSISAEVAQAYNNGAWNGPANAGGGVITSSLAAVDPNHLTAVGVATNLSTFQGQSVSTSDVLIKETYYGDANLSGTVDGSDYTLIDNGYLSNLTGWSNGDFNYDGVVNGSDYTLIDNAFNTQGATLSSEIASPTAQISGTSATSAVPEPASLGLILTGFSALLGRRRRRI